MYELLLHTHFFYLNILVVPFFNYSLILTFLTFELHSIKCAIRKPQPQKNKYINPNQQPNPIMTDSIAYTYEILYFKTNYFSNTLHMACLNAAPDGPTKS